MIRILKASAGSGKTYNLARAYLECLFKSKDRYAYRHILAVTFTNKATAEMKSRILKELYILSEDPRQSNYFGDFVPAYFATCADLQKASFRMLTGILHDYSAFSVSTIDKFFQQTLKAFSREIGMFSSYQIELDKPSLIAEAVDRMLDSLTDDQTDIVKWMNDAVGDQLRNGEKIRLEATLSQIGARLKSDEFARMAESSLWSEESFSKKRLSEIRKKCSEIIEDFHKKVTAEAFAAPDMKYIDCYRRTFSSSEAVPAPKKTLLKNAPLSFCSLFEKEFKIYNTARIIRDLTFSLGLAREFLQSFDALVRDKNVISIDDTNTILKGIIDGSDAPFVYEKTGVRYENFLLDEFQDTSLVQWANFRPLLAESDACGHDCLVVGDVKQSIYRWRGSDWRLLDSILPSQFAQADIRSLDSNYRSLEEIVKFNNGFFSYASSLLKLENLYADVNQAPKAAEGKEKGSVEVSFCDPDDQTSVILESIAKARNAGARWGDVAILVRNNREGSSIAEELIRGGIPVVTDDSLEVKSSRTVRSLVSVLRNVENSKDKISSYICASLGVKIPDSFNSLVDLCESLLGMLRERDPELFDSETLYIQSFVDTLQDWSQTYGNNLLQFLKHWDEISPKISSPSQSDSIRIMTIHKSKGLEFPYVIFPYAEKVTLYGTDTRWCRPRLEGTPLEGVADSIYPVSLTSGIADTLFCEDLEKERALQVVDNLNVFYVALTRAVKGLHVIAANPAAKCVDAFRKGAQSYDFKDMSQILYWYTQKYGAFRGEMYDYGNMPRKKSGITAVPYSYVCFDKTSRLSLCADASDFFSEDGLVGAAASRRINGNVLHSILSAVDVPEDLPGAVEAAVLRGDISPEEAKEHQQILCRAIDSVRERGWFSRRSLREVSVIGTDGEVFRPDRVLIDAQKAVVIDYKFGEPRKKHASQVASYKDLFRRMGYTDVSGYLWYVYEGRIVEI